MGKPSFAVIPKVSGLLLARYFQTYGRKIVSKHRPRAIQRFGQDNFIKRSPHCVVLVYSTVCSDGVRYSV